MRFNDKELRQYIKSVPTVELEGNLTYFDFKEGAKERRVKLLNSLMLLFKVSPQSVIVDLEPSEVIVLTSSTIRQGAGGSNSFEIVCESSPFDNVFTFYCKSPSERDRWISALKLSSLHRLESEIQRLRLEIKRTDKVSKRRTAPPIPSGHTVTIRTHSPSTNRNTQCPISIAEEQVTSNVPVAPRDMPLIDFS